MPYHHITQEERIKIEAWLSAGYSIRMIADQLGRAPSSISREITRNYCGSGFPYVAKHAEHRRRSFRRWANEDRRKITPGSPLAALITEKVSAYWSPEQVSGRLRREQMEQTVCTETIYQYVYRERRDLIRFLRCRKGRYRRRYGTKLREIRREEAKKRRIDVRPAVIEKRQRIGDWEGDTIVGQERTTHILTHTERKSGYLLADKVLRATAENVRRLTVRRFERLPKKKILSITYDNGVQFEEHEMTERLLKIFIYFAHPYHSWERGTNENTNGLLRQFFPKRTPFADLTQGQISRAVRLINTRPRKRLDYQTPDEVFNSRCCSLT